jgi:hypothetical protein
LKPHYKPRCQAYASLLLLTAFLLQDIENPLTSASQLSNLLRPQHLQLGAWTGKTRGYNHGNAAVHSWTQGTQVTLPKDTLKQLDSCGAEKQQKNFLADNEVVPLPFCTALNLPSYNIYCAFIIFTCLIIIHLSSGAKHAAAPIRRLR